MVDTKIANYATGKMIKDIRSNLGDDLEKFGNRLDPPAAASLVSRWERGVNLPNSSRLKQIADIGQIDIKDFANIDEIVKSALDVLSVNDANTMDMIELNPDYEKRFNLRFKAAIRKQLKNIEQLKKDNMYSPMINFDLGLEIAEDTIESLQNNDLSDSGIYSYFRKSLLQFNRDLYSLYSSSTDKKQREKLQTTVETLQNIVNKALDAELQVAEQNGYNLNEITNDFKEK